MKTYTIRFKIEGVKEIVADNHESAMEALRQADFGSLITRNNSTVTAVTEDMPAAEIPDEGTGEGSGEGSGEGDAE